MKFPNEDRKYRAARDSLLKAELALRKQTEKVAAQRRKLPPGGEVPEDYVFEAVGGPVRLSQLFERGNTLVAYSFMYGPKMARACPMCTAMLDALNGNAPHIAQRSNLVVIAKSPLARIAEYAKGRGWSNLKLLSSEKNSYSRDYHAESPDGSQLPILNVFVKNKEVRHWYATELLFAKAEPGQDPRHVDSIWPLWNLFDLTPAGRGTDRIRGQGRNSFSRTQKRVATLTPNSAGSVAREGDPVHHAAVAVVVVDRVVLGAAVVPERERADLPLEAAGEFRLDLVPEEIVEQRRAFLLGHAAKAHGVRDVHVERLAPSFGMYANDGVLREVFLGLILIPDAVFASARDVCF
jgi:predicted dithiol-disulfide oxidoreductase (DUF899 family)